jgi:N,N'-diacetyllegionaminate synthase
MGKLSPVGFSHPGDELDLAQQRTEWMPGPLRAAGCGIIAEVAQAHDGSLGTAHAYVDAAATAGADAVKFQTHIADAESTPEEPWRVPFSPQDATRYDYWRRMEFTGEQWAGLKRHADDRGLLFLSSPFSSEAASLLERVGVAAWKVASGEVGNTVLLEQLLGTGLPILLSTGMSSFEEIDAAVDRIRSRKVPLTLLQCTSRYPTPPEEVGLNLLDTFRRRYECGVGLSDHSGTIYPSLAAAALGASVVEVHVTFSRDAFGPDISSSVTTRELAQLVEGVRFVDSMLANPVNKDEAALDLEPTRVLFTKSVVASQDLRAGTLLERNHVRLKKPGTGIPAGRMEQVLGRRLRADVHADQILQEADFE